MTTNDPNRKLLLTDQPNLSEACFLGFTKSKGYSITNLGKYESNNIEEAAFLPPASPAIKKTLGVLTVNGKFYSIHCYCMELRSLYGYKRIFFVR